MKLNYKLILAAILICSLISCSSTKKSQDETTFENIIFVDTNANGDNNGTSWNNAYNDLQDAISSSNYGDSIWVAEGTYYASTTDQEESFSLVDGTNLYGGFEGTETSIDQRDINSNETILDGDFLNTPDDDTDNTNNILLATNGIIDGFTIQNGYSSSMLAMGSPPSGKNDNENDKKSAGHSSPEQVTSGNAETTRNGAAIVVWAVSAEIKNVTIKNCYSDKGGAIYVNDTSNLDTQPLFYNVIVEDCSSFSRGGGISIDYKSSPIFIDCQFINNFCNGKGGAIYDDFACSPYFYNCLFLDNTCEFAAGIGNDGYSNPKIVNSTFTGNYSIEDGAALYQGSGGYNDPIVINCVVSDNISDNGNASIYNFNECNTAVYDSIIEGGYYGTGDNIIDTKAIFDENYNCLTNTEIGFNYSDCGNRDDEEIFEIINYLLSIEMTELPTILDHSNKSDLVSETNTIYVDLKGNGDGSSSDNSLSDLQKAIYMANNYYVENGEEVNIYIADGTYTAGNSRIDSFMLLEGVNLIGESQDGTILSGEIGDSSIKSDNTYHVIIGSDKASINNLTITGGYADAQGDDAEEYDRLGGGLFNYLSGNRNDSVFTDTIVSDAEVTDSTFGFNTTVNNVTFVDNYAILGGASYTYFGGSPIFSDCNFIDNSAEYAGATYDVSGCGSGYNNCTYENNTAEYVGGAAMVDYGSLTQYIDCTFNNNSAKAGGVVYILDRASQEIENDTHFSDLIDSSWTNNYDIFSTVYFDNCSFNNNTAQNGGNIFYAIESSFVKLVNTKIDSSDYYLSFNSTIIE
ncbi:MAG: hypothetical protein ACPKM0_00140 [Pleomorphochaeta sp.]